MAKRFFDTDKYKKHFYRGLKGAYKLLWDYILCDCNNAGIWIVDFQIASVYLGDDINVNEKEAIECFNRDEIRVFPFNGGKQWFIVPFIEFQYGVLNPSNRAHGSVINTLVGYGLMDEDLSYTFLQKYKNKPLVSPLYGAMDMDKDMDKDIVKDRGMGEEFCLFEEKTIKEQKKNNGKQAKGKSQFDVREDLSYVSEEMLDIWNEWLDYKDEIKKQYKTQRGAKMQYTSLVNYSNGNAVLAMSIVKRSIEQSWDGLFSLSDKQKELFMSKNNPYLSNKEEYNAQNNNDSITEWQ